MSNGELKVTTHRAPYECINTTGSCGPKKVSFVTHWIIAPFEILKHVTSSLHRTDATVDFFRGSSFYPGAVTIDDLNMLYIINFAILSMAGTFQFKCNLLLPEKS
jgi:hypothetical protein